MFAISEFAKTNKQKTYFWIMACVFTLGTFVLSTEPDVLGFLYDKSDDSFVIGLNALLVALLSHLTNKKFNYKSMNYLTWTSLFIALFTFMITFELRTSLVLILINSILFAITFSKKKSLIIFAEFAGILMFFITLGYLGAATFSNVEKILIGLILLIMNYYHSINQKKYSQFMLLPIILITGASLTNLNGAVPLIITAIVLNVVYMSFFFVKEFDVKFRTNNEVILWPHFKSH